MDERGVTFRWKDYRAKGETRHKTMTLGADEFMRRFLLHVLPGGFHRIRHYGPLLTGRRKKTNPAGGEELLHILTATTSPPASTNAGVRQAAVRRLPLWQHEDRPAGCLHARGRSPRPPPRGTLRKSDLFCSLLPPTPALHPQAPARHDFDLRGVLVVPLPEISATSTPKALEIPGTTPLPLSDAQRRLLGQSAPARPPESP